MKIFALLFRGPWWIALGLSAGLILLGFWMQAEGVERAAARAALLAQDPPATVPVTAAMGEAGRDPVEVSVSAQVVTGHTTRLVEKTNFITTDETVFYVLAAPDAGAGPVVAQAGILIDPGEVDAFADWAAAHATGFGAHGPVVTVDGLKAYGAERSLAEKAMREQGVVQAEGFFFIEPFLAGRAASLSAPPAASVQAPWIVWGFAALLALAAVLKARRVPAPAPAAAPALPEGLLYPVAGGGLAPAAALQAEIDRKGLAAAMAEASVTAAPAAAPMPRRRWAGLAVLAAVAGVAVAAALGHWEVFGLVPVLIVGGFYFLLYRGTRMVGRAAGAAADRLRSAPATPLAEAGPAVPAPAAAVTASAPDRFAAGPVRKGGFSLAALMPRRRAAVPDGFDRLAAMVAAERRREGQLQVLAGE